jgi:hypothetical protein
MDDEAVLMEALFGRPVERPAAASNLHAIFIAEPNAAVGPNPAPNSTIANVNTNPPTASGLFSQKEKKAKLAKTV